MLKVLLENIDNVQKQMDNVNRNGHSKKESKGNTIIEATNTVTEMKNVFDGFIHRLYMAKERIHELKDMPIETSQMEMQTKKRELKKGTEY